MKVTEFLFRILHCGSATMVKMIRIQQELDAQRGCVVEPILSSRLSAPCYLQKNLKFWDNEIFFNVIKKLPRN